MTAVLQVATPEGVSGKILSSAGDYLFRDHEDAKMQAAISLLKNKSVPFSPFSFHMMHRLRMQLYAQGMHHLDDRLEARLGAWGKGLIETFTAQA